MQRATFLGNKENLETFSFLRPSANEGCLISGIIDRFGNFTLYFFRFDWLEDEGITS